MRTAMERETERKEFVQIMVPAGSVKAYEAQGWEVVGEPSGRMVTVRKSIRK